MSSICLSFATKNILTSPPPEGRGFQQQLRKSKRFCVVILAGSCCWRHYSTAHFTGEPGMSCPFDIYSADMIGISLKPHSTHLNAACVLRLSFAMQPHSGTSPACILWSTLTSQPPTHASLYSAVCGTQTTPDQKWPYSTRTWPLRFFPVLQLFPPPT